MLSKETRRHLKTMLTIGTILALLLGLWIAFAPTNSTMHYQRVRRELQDSRDKNSRLAAKNDELQEEIKRLKNDPAFLEKVARRQEGLIKKNETIYDFGAKK